MIKQILHATNEHYSFVLTICCKGSFNNYFEMLRTGFIFLILLVAFFLLELNYCRCLFHQEVQLEKNVITSKELQGKNLPLSSAQNWRFHRSKGAVLSFVKRRKPHMLYSPKETPYFAIPLNDELAYRHIFKNGGEFSWMLRFPIFFVLLGYKSLMFISMLFERHHSSESVKDEQTY